MNIIKDKRGLSRLEVLCITGICILLALSAYWGICYYRDSLDKGNDSMRVNTAESVARNNLLSDGCVVDNCTQEDDTCTHKTADGRTVGYYDSVSHHIVADKMQGYNEYEQTSAENAKLEGKAGTMILAVYGKDKEVTLKWIEGDNI